MKYCSLCADGETRSEADYKVKGSIDGRGFIRNVCSDHMEVIAEDADWYEVIDYISHDARVDLMHITFDKYQEAKKVHGANSKQAYSIHRRFCALQDALGFND